MTPSPGNIPQLYKDLWLNVILRKMDDETLIDFSAASKETRQLAFAELFKRPGFNYKFYKTIHCSLAYDERHFEYLRSNAKWGKSGVSTLIARAGIVIGMYSLYALMNMLRMSPDGAAAGDLFKEQVITFVLAGCAYAIADTVFNYTNRFEIKKFENERMLIERNQMKAEQLRHLRDEMPKQVVSTHSLFRKFIDTSEETKPSQFCAIL